VLAGDRGCPGTTGAGGMCMTKSRAVLTGIVVAAAASLGR